MRLLTPEDFEPWVGRPVRINTLPRPVEVLLARIERMPRLAGLDIRDRFSLMFEAPLNVMLMDAAYEFDCGRGGPYQIHINQLIPTPQARRYQAIFT